MQINRRRLAAVCLASIALGGVLGVGVPVIAQTETDPIRPSWIREDGTIDESQYPADGIPVFDLEGNLACRVDLTTYLNAGGAMAVDILTESNTPADEFEADASSSHTDLDEELLDRQLAVEVAGSTLCSS